MKTNISETLENNKKFLNKNKNLNNVRHRIWKLFSPKLNKEENKAKLPITENEKKELYDLLKDKDKDEETLNHLIFIFNFLNDNRHLNILDKEIFNIIENIFKICMDYVLGTIKTNSQQNISKN